MQVICTTPHHVRGTHSFTSRFLLLIQCTVSSKLSSTLVDSSKPILLHQLSLYFPITYFINCLLTFPLPPPPSPIILFLVLIVINLNTSSPTPTNVNKHVYLGYSQNFPPLALFFPNSSIPPVDNGAVVILLDLQSCCQLGAQHLCLSLVSLAKAGEGRRVARAGRHLQQYNGCSEVLAKTASINKL